jgi:threonine aldolase
MNFASDNASGVAPEIVAAIERANTGAAMPYGDDPITGRLTARFAEVFETDLAVFPVATGTAANALALAQLAPSHGAVYCHRESHIEADECGAPEFYTGGAKLVLLDGAGGKIQPDDLAYSLERAGTGIAHHVQPAALSISQSTECGTVYSPSEIAELARIAKAHGLGVHMDGARFANALTHLGCEPADVTWRAGIDILSFGATKNGALAAEAVVFFKPELAVRFIYQRKRGGHLFSKMRFFSAQLEAYLEDGLWLRLAAKANDCAARLADGLAALPGAAIAYPVDANEVFATLPEGTIRHLEGAGVEFYRWGGPGATTIRLVASFNTELEAVNRLIALVRESGVVEAAG